MKLFFLFVFLSIVIDKATSSWVSHTVPTPAGGLVAGDDFGKGGNQKSIAVSDGKMVVGASGDDTDGNGAGAVYTYTWSGTAWVEGPELVSPTTLEAVDQFGRTVAMSGNRLAVAAWGDNTAGTNAGVVYTYEWSGSAWVAGPELTFTGVGAGDRFGATIMIDGDRMAIGATSDDSSQGANSGAVYMYEWSGSAWTEVEKLKPAGLIAADSFGVSIGLSGDKMVIGANSDDTVASGAGAVYPYTWSGSAWVEGTKIAPTSLLANDSFGKKVSMSGDIFVAGVEADDETGTSSGIVYTFTWSGSSWVQLSPELAPSSGHVASLYFGSDVALSGSNLAVGAFGYAGTGIRLGAVYIFSWTGTAWSQDEVLIGSGTVDYTSFGVAVVMSGRELVVSANYDLAGADTGYVTAFRLPPIACTATTDCTATEVCSNLDVCDDAPSCTANADCFGTLTAGRLSYCNTVTGFCVDKYAGTCTSTNDCTVKHLKALTKETGIGSVSQTVTVSNTTAARETVTKLSTDILSGTTVTNDIHVFVTAEETATLDDTIFNTIGDDTEVLAHIKSVVCADIGEELCVVSIPARRLLSEHERDLVGSIVVSITYEIDIDVFNSLQASSSFSDPSFASALAAAAGVDIGNVTVSTSSGTFTIDYVVADESTGSDPLTEAALQSISDLEADVGTITATVISQLGLDSGDVSTAVVDKCADRDCNGRGTCNASTGVCACADTSYWGINCETAVDCTTGDAIVIDGKAYCECTYPKFGQRCVGERDCETCA